MKCAVYARVSTENESQKTSIPAQIKLFENYIKDKGWEIAEIYTDVKSGTSINRNGMNQLLEDAKAKKFDIIIAKEFSRISRNGAFSYEFRDTIRENNIHFITLDGTINTLDNASNKFGLYAWMAEDEAERCSIRVKSSYQARAKSGKFDAAPYGYDLVNGNLHIAEDGSAEVVKRIYNLYIQGRSFDAISRILIAENIETPAARKNKRNANKYWHGSTVRQILERKIYTGTFIGGKSSTVSVTSKKRLIIKPEDWIVVEGTHEAIISKDDFNLVQQLIKSRKRIRSQQSTHVFTGLLICGNCGAGMHFKRDRYVCGKQNKFGKAACSDNFRAIESKLIKALLNDINNIYFSTISEKTIDTLLEKQLTKFEADLADENRKDSISLALDKLTKRKKKAINLLLDESIDKDDYDLLMKELNPQIDQLKDELHALVESDTTAVDRQQLKAYIQSQLNPKQVLTELTTTIIARFINKIIVKADGQLEVHYRTSKPSAFYVSTDIKLTIPKTHPNKAYVEKHA